MKVIKKIGRKFSMVSLIPVLGFFVCLQNSEADIPSNEQINKEVKIEQTDHEEYIIQPSLIISMSF
jgi:hypothetical protein